MDLRWQPLTRDSLRQTKIILHPVASITEVRRGEYEKGDDSIDLSEFVTTASHTAFDASVTLHFNRELFGEKQPKPNQILEIQLRTLGQQGTFKPLWLGVIDAISSFTLQRGERSVQLVAKSRDSQDIWRNTKRVTPLFPQMTDLAYISQRIARTAGLKHDEIVLPPSSYFTAHSNTQLADMNAWDMLETVFMPLGWTPFIDGLGRLRAADRSLQGRKVDAKLTDDRIIKVTGSRQKPPVSRVRVIWKNPLLKMWMQMGQLVTTVDPVVIGWFMPYYKRTVYFSEDKTKRATNTWLKAVDGNTVNRFSITPFIRPGWGGKVWKGDGEAWRQQAPNMGKLFWINLNFPLMAWYILTWVGAHSIPDQVPLIHQHTVVALGGGKTDIPYITPPTIYAPTPVEVTKSVGRIKEGIAAGVFLAIMMNAGVGQYEIWGNPYEFVHARNVSDAFDSSVPTWIDNAEEIESDFVINEEHAKLLSIRELIYRSRAANKWSVTIVDDPRIEYGDILEFHDGTQLYVQDFTRKLERGAEATLDIQGFIVGPVKGLVGKKGIGTIVGGGNESKPLPPPLGGSGPSGPSGPSGSGDAECHPPDGSATVNQVNADHPELLQTNTNDSCGQFTELVVNALHALDPGWGHVGKSGAQTQYNGHAIDAIMHKDCQSKVVDIISASKNHPIPGSPSWHEDGSYGQPFVPV